MSNESMQCEDDGVWWWDEREGAHAVEDEGRWGRGTTPCEVSLVTFPLRLAHSHSEEYNDSTATSSHHHHFRCSTAMEDDVEEMAALRRARLSTPPSTATQSTSTTSHVASLPTPPPPRSPSSSDTPPPLAGPLSDKRYRFEPLILSPLPPLPSSSLSTSTTSLAPPPQPVPSDDAEDAEDGEDAEAAALRAFLPGSFGAKKVHNKAPPVDVHAVHQRTPALQLLPTSTSTPSPTSPTPRVKREEEGESGNGGEREGGDGDSHSPTPHPLDAYHLPITHTVDFPPASTPPKSLLSLTLSVNGTRLLTGSSDAQVRLYDFPTSTSALTPFRTVSPIPDHPVLHLRHPLSSSSTPPSQLLVVGGWGVVVLDGEGKTMVGTVKGDQYLLDQRHTKGHTAAVTDAQWHPLDGGVWGSAGRDGTVRIWDVTHKGGVECREVVKMRGVVRGVGVSSLAWAGGGGVLATAATDGAIRLFHRAGLRWNERMSSPVGVGGQWVSAMAFMKDEQRLLLRTQAGVTVVDVRRMKEVVGQLALSSDSEPHELTDFAVTPDEAVLLTGVGGELAFVSTADVRLLSTLPLSQKTLVRTAYHPVLNEVFATSTAGVVHCLYSPTLSKRGVLLALTRHAKVKAWEGEGEGRVTGPIINPHSIPVYAESKEDRKRKRGAKEGVGALPPLKKGEGGRMATSTNMTQFMMRRIVERKVGVREVDPREALLAMEGKMGGKKLFTAAYDRTQPTPIFQQEDEGEEEEVDEKHGSG